MTRKYFIILFGLLLFYNLLIFPIDAQKSKKTNQWNAKDKEILLIPSLAKQGYLSFTFDNGGFYIQVEPLFWQRALHQEKVKLVKAAMETARFMNEQKNMNLTIVMFFNMTTHEELAYGFITGLNPGKFEILK